MSRGVATICGPCNTMGSECYGLLTPVRPVLTGTADTAVVDYAPTTKPEQSREADVRVRFRFSCGYLAFQKPGLQSNGKWILRKNRCISLERYY